MTHRERVTRALSHKEPDRVPIDVWGSASRLCNDLYLSIVKDQGWNGLGPMAKASRSGDYVDERVDVLVDSDFRHLDIGHPKLAPKRTGPNGERISEWGWGTREVHGSSLVTYSPLASAEDVSAIDGHQWPCIADPGRIEGLAEKARRLAEGTDCFLGATSAVSGMILEIGQYLRGFEQFMMDLYINESFAHHLIGKIADIITELYLYYVTPIAPWVGWVEFSSDHGTQDRPLVSPEIYRKFFKAPYTRIFAAVKKAAPNAKIWLHSCGSVRELIPDFIEAGVDVLNSLQPKAAGMDSFELKKEFGSELVFHGGLDLQGGITGSVAEAIDEAKRRIDAFAKGGGYIFAPSNHFMQDVPMENFYAVYRTAREYGVYRHEGKGEKK
jgi:uroporphyrinogen decarboxylase